MPYTLILAAALHVLTTAFWAGTTFALARTGGAAAERLFGPQLAAALLAFVSGGYLGHTLHAHAFGRPEQVLMAAIGASAMALLVQAALVGHALGTLRDGARDQAPARARVALAHRVAAVLLGLAAIGMATARYLPPSGATAADAPERFADSRTCRRSPNIDASEPARLQTACEPQPAPLRSGLRAECRPVSGRLRVMRFDEPVESRDPAEPAAIAEDPCPDCTRHSTGFKRRRPAASPATTSRSPRRHGPTNTSGGSVNDNAPQLVFDDSDVDFVLPGNQDRLRPRPAA